MERDNWKRRGKNRNLNITIRLLWASHMDYRYILNWLDNGMKTSVSITIREYIKLNGARNLCIHCGNTLD